jgi:hypothetical protein
MIQGMDDDRLLQEIGRLLRRAEPVPPDVTLAARSALAWRRMDAELAELLYDSAAETEPLTGVRSTATGWRVLTFEGPGMTVEVEISLERSRRTLVGQIIPPSPAHVIVRLPGAEHAVQADELGRFVASDLKAGPVSLRCEPADGGAIETGWVTI